MSVRGINKSIVKGVGSALVNLALIASPFSLGNAVHTYYSNRRGDYARNKSYLKDDRLRVLSNDIWARGKSVPRPEPGTYETVAFTEDEIGIKKNVAVKELTRVHYTETTNLHLFTNERNDAAESRNFLTPVSNRTLSEEADALELISLDAEDPGNTLYDFEANDSGDLAIHKGDISAIPAWNSIARNISAFAFTGTIQFDQIKTAGDYFGAASVDAEFYTSASKEYTLVADGTTGGTGAYYSPAALEDGVFTYNGETKIRLNFSNNETFNVDGSGSIYVMNYSGAGRTFSFTSDDGIMATSYLGNNSGGYVNLSSNNSDITYVDITASGDMYAHFSLFKVANITPASSNNAPVIGETSADQNVNDNATISPFSAVTVTEPDGDNVSATITLDTAAKGVLSGTGLSDDGGGEYSVSSRTAASLQSVLRGLVYNPTDNRTATSETTTFTLEVSDGSDSDSDNTTTVISSAVAPTISNVSIPNNTMNIGDVVTATITVSSDADNYTTGSGGISGTIGGFTLGSLSRTNSTTYTATFTVTEGGTDVAAGNTIPVNFTLTDSGGATSSAFTTAISQNADEIDANSPALSSTSPVDGATDVAPGSNITLTFDEDIAFGTGNIEIIDLDDDSGTITINAASPGVQASVSGSTLTLNPTSSLETPVNFAVQIASTAIEDDAGNPYAGIADNTTFNFTTGADSDGSLTAAGSVSEPVGLSSVIDSEGEAVDVFDFNLSDGGTSDGLMMSVSAITVNVSGTSTDDERDQITWLLNGNDVSNVEGSYSAGELTFSGLSISIADNDDEDYTISAYYNDNTNLTEDNTIILSVDGDSDVTTGGGGTGMGSTSPVTNGSGSTIDIFATELVFTTQPAGSVSGAALTTQPVVTAQDAFGNTDADFTETITLTEASAGNLSGNTQAATSGVATFSGLTYTASADQESFTLTANDQDGVGSDLPTVDANALTSDVVASELSFSTEPAPTSFPNGEATDLTTDPVVQAVDGNGTVDTGYSTIISLAEVNGAGSVTMTGTGDNDGNGATVSLTPSSGVATFTNLSITYTLSGASNETFNLQASSGALTTANSTQLTGLANEPPEVADLPSDITVLEETASDVDLSDAVFSDPEGDGLTVTLTVSSGSFSTPADGAGVGSGVAETLVSVTTITLSGTAGDINTYLDTPSNIQYTGASNISGDDSATLTVNANDGTVNPQLGTVNIDITDINDQPTLTATGDNPGYTEDAAASGLFSGVTASTVEGTQSFTSMTLTVTNVSDGADEILGFDGSDIELTNGNSVTTATNSLTVDVSVTGGTATVDFSGESLSELQLETLVGDLDYRNTSDNPTTGSNRTVTITEIIDDGGTTNDGDDTTDLSLTSTVSLTAVNNPPVLANLDGDNTGLQPGSAELIDQGDDVTLSNADSPDYDGGNLEIVDNGSNNTANGAFSVDGTNATSGGDAAISSGETIAVGGTSIGTVDATNDGQGGNNLTINFNSANATSARIQTLLRNLQWSAVAGTDAQTFTLFINDGDGTANGGDEDVSAGFTMTLGNLPVIANFNGDEVDFLVDGDPVILDDDADATLSDADSPANLNGGNLTASVTANAAAAEDILTIDTSGSVSLAGTTAGSNVSVSGTVIGTLSNNIAAGNDLGVNFNTDATLSRVQSLLRSLQYDNDSSPVAETDRDVSVTITDNDGLTSSAAVVTVTTVVNQPPTLTATGSNPDFTEGGSAVGLFSGASVSTVEPGQTLTGLTLSISNISGSGDEVLGFGGRDVDLTDGLSVTIPVHSFTINVSVTGSTATVSFSGASLSAAALQTLINNISYVIDSNDPGSSDHVVSIVELIDSGGSANGGNNTATISISSTISVTRVNHAPTLATTSTDPSFSEDDTPVNLFSGTSISSIESSQTLGSFELLVTPVNDTSEEFLVADGTSIELTDGEGGTTETNGLSYAVTTSGAGVSIEFTGATLSEGEAETFVDELAYHNTSVDPDETDRVVTLVEMTDSGGTDNGGDDTVNPSIISTVELLSVNDPPVIDNLDGDNTSLLAGNTAVIDNGSDFSVSNVDAADYESGYLEIVDNGDNNTADGNFSVDGANVTSGGDGVIAAGESIVVDGTAIGTVDVHEDGQSGNSLVIDFENTDATSARIETLVQNLLWGASAGTGAQTFTLTLNDEDGTLNGGDNDDTADFTMTLGNMPVVSNLDGDEVDFLVDGPAVGLDVDGDASLSDTDSPANLNGGNLTVSVTSNAASAEDILTFNTSGSIALEGTSAGDDVSVGATVVGTLGNAIAAGNDLVVNFNTDATLSLVQSLIRTLQYDNEASPVAESTRDVSVTVTDNNGLTSTAAIVTVTTIANQPPTLTATGDDPDFTEEGTAVGLFSSATASSTETGQALTSLTLTITNVSGGAGEIINIDGSDVALTNGNSVTTVTNGLTVNVSVSGSTATVSFSGATLSEGELETLVEELTYINTTDDPGSSNRVVTIDELVDSGGTANGGNDTADPAITSTVAITEVNDAPVLTATGTNPSFSEDDSPVELFSAASISTVEAGQTLGGFSILVTPVNDASDEFLVADGSDIELTGGEGGTTDSNGMTYAVTTSGAGVSIDFTGGTLSENEAEVFINALAYQNRAVNPDETDRVVTLAELTDSGGTANGGINSATPLITSIIEITDLILAAPSLVSATPADGESDVELDPDISLTLDRAVSVVDLSGVTITDDNDTPVDGVTASLSSDQLLEIAYDELVPNKTYTVTIPSGAVENIDGVTNNKITVTFSTIEHGLADASESTADVPAEGLTGDETIITITVRDAYGNPVPGAGSDVSVRVLSGPNEGAGFSSITGIGGGTYTTGYTPAAAGTDQISITVDGDAIDNSPFSHEVIAEVVIPGAPTNLLADAGNMQADLEWLAPANDGDGTISDYIVQYSTNGGTTWNDATGEGPSTARTVSNLLNNVGHQFRVAAVNEAGMGPYSQPSGLVIPTAPVPAASGDLPDLDPGLFEGLQDGTPLEFSVEVDDNGALNLVLLGSDLNLVLTTLDSNGQSVPISEFDELLRLFPGQGSSFLVAGNGFEPGSFVTVWLFSDPIRLGTIQVDANGKFSQNLLLPDDLEEGEHTLQVRGRNPAGQEVSVNLGVLVSAMEAPVNSTPPVITNTEPLRIGTMAEADLGEWSGTPEAVLSAQWLHCEDAEQPIAECIAVEEATGLTYEIEPDDLGHWMRVQVTAYNGIYEPVSASSTTAGPVGAGTVATSVSTASVPDGLAGQPTAITINLEDEHGNPVSGQAGNLILSVADGPNQERVFSEVEDQGDGVYRTNYTPHLPGIDRISIMLEGQPVGDSPYSSQVGPLENELEYNYPNPFSGLTTIEYSVVEQGKVMLQIYDVLGRLIETLVDTPSREPGEYSEYWNSNGLAGGVYYYRLVITPADGGEPFEKTRALTLIR